MRKGIEEACSTHSAAAECHRGEAETKEEGTGGSGGALDRRKEKFSEDTGKSVWT